MLEKVVKVFRNAHVTPCQGSFEFCPRGPLASHLLSSAWRVGVGGSHPIKQNGHPLLWDPHRVLHPVLQCALALYLACGTHTAT